MKGGRKAINLQKKLSIIQEIDKGIKQVDVAKKHGSSTSTIHTIVKNREIIFNSLEKFNKKSERLRTSKKANIDEALYVWFAEKRKQNVPIDSA